MLDRRADTKVETLAQGFIEGINLEGRVRNTRDIDAGESSLVGSTINPESGAGFR